MSASLSLQDAILAALKNDAEVQALVGARIWDRAPDKAAFPHITFGPSDIVPEDYECISARVETVQIDIWSRDQGKKWPCKRIVDAVKGALHRHTADLGDHALASLRVTLARVVDDPDGITVHGIVTCEATVEEG